MQVTIKQAILELAIGDITLQDTDAIVNAANSTLRGGSGVDGAIHKRGGPQILKECIKIGGCPTGEARITSGGNLNARFVIHTVGPIYSDGKKGESKLLASAYRNSLQLARENGIKSIAFPSISTGAYGYPVTLAAPIALQTVIDDLNQRGEINLVRFVLFNQNIFSVYQAALNELLRGSSFQPP